MKYNRSFFSYIRRNLGINILLVCVMGVILFALIIVSGYKEGLEQQDFGIPTQMRVSIIRLMNSILPAIRSRSSIRLYQALLEASIVLSCIVRIHLKYSTIIVETMPPLLPFTPLISPLFLIR